LAEFRKIETHQSQKARELILGKNAAAGKALLKPECASFRQTSALLRKARALTAPPPATIDRAFRLPKQMAACSRRRGSADVLRGLLCGKVRARADFLEADILGDININRSRLAVQGIGKSPAA